VARERLLAARPPRAITPHRAGVWGCRAFPRMASPSARPHFRADPARIADVGGASKLGYGVVVDNVKVSVLA